MVLNRKLVTMLTTTLLLFAVAAQSQPNAAPQLAPSPKDYDPTKAKTTAAAEKPASDTINKTRTLLWEVKSTSPKPNTLYLFGTIHVGKASFYPLPDAVNAAFTARDRKSVV